MYTKLHVDENGIENYVPLTETEIEELKKFDEELEQPNQP